MLHGVAEENYRKSFLRRNRVNKISSEPDAVIKRATSGSRAIGSWPLVQKLFWSFCLFAHWRWWWGRFERMVLTHHSSCWGLIWQHSRLLAHYNCCLGPLWKHITYTLKLLLVATLKARYLHITIVGGGPFEIKVLKHYNCCWGHFEST